MPHLPATSALNPPRPADSPRPAFLRPACLRRARGLAFGTFAVLLLAALPARLSAQTQFPDSLRTPGGDSLLTLESFEHPRHLGLFPPDWQARKGGWRTASPDEIYYKIRLEDDNHYLSAETTGEAIDAGVEANVNLRIYNKVRWRWRVWSLPIGATEEDKDKNDSGAAVRLVFYGGYRPRMLKYVWSSTLPVGTRTESAGNEKIKVIVLRSGSNQLGEWLWEEVNAYRDYKELFGGEPRAVRVLGIITDSDNTDTFVKADYDDFSFLIARPDTTRKAGGGNAPGANSENEDGQTDE